MARKEDIRSFCNPAKPSWAERTQLDQLTGEVYPAGQRAELIRSLRRGTIVEVVETFLLARTVGRSDARKRDLLQVVDEIEDRGAVIRELATGHQSNVPKQWRQMQARAFAQIVASARGRNAANNGRKSKGRPRKCYPPEQLAVMSKVWFDRRYTTVAERVKVLEAQGIKVRRGWLYQTLGTAENPKID